MVMVYCSTFGLRFVYMVSALLLRSSNPGGTTKKRTPQGFSFFVVLGISSMDDVERRHLSLVCSCGDGLCASTQPSLQHQKPTAMLYIDGHSPFQSCFHRIAHLMLVEPIWLWFIARPLVCALFIWYRLYCSAVRIRWHHKKRG